MSAAAIAGVGMHPFGRFPDASLKDLARVAIVNALDDAGMSVRDVDAVYSSNGMAGLLQGQEQIRGQTVLGEVGIERVPVVNVENACASGSSALREAVLAVRAGAAERILVVGFEKMFVDDRDRSLQALETAADIEVIGGLGLQFTAVYAMRLRQRVESGLLEQRHLVDVAVKSRANAVRNPNAQRRTAVTREEVEQSRPIADPLTLLMCSAICDGAAAVVVTAAEPGARVLVRAAEATSGFTPSAADDGVTPTTLCAAKAYAAAGLGPADVDVAEVHDAMAPAELAYYEELGFCGVGDAGALLESGATAIGGKIAVNPSGGLTSRGHPVGATGLAQVAELTWQLRGEAGARQSGRPRIALAHNCGGWLAGGSAACNIHILEGRAS